MVVLINLINAQSSVFKSPHIFFCTLHSLTKKIQKSLRRYLHINASRKSGTLLFASISVISKYIREFPLQNQQAISNGSKTVVIYDNNLHNMHLRVYHNNIASKLVYPVRS